VCAVQGGAFGAGLQLALACDLRVVGPDTRLGFLEIRYGIIPDLGGIHRAVQLLGPGTRQGSGPHRPGHRCRRGVPGGAGRPGGAGVRGGGSGTRLPGSSGVHTASTNSVRDGFPLAGSCRKTSASLTGSGVRRRSMVAGEGRQTGPLRRLSPNVDLARSIVITGWRRFPRVVIQETGGRCQPAVLKTRSGG
jgi:hypothetical protein